MCEIFHHESSVTMEIGDSYQHDILRLALCLCVWLPTLFYTSFTFYPLPSLGTTVFPWWPRLMALGAHQRHQWIWFTWSVHRSSFCKYPGLWVHSLGIICGDFFLPMLIRSRTDQLSVQKFLLRSSQSLSPFLSFQLFLFSFSYLNILLLSLLYLFGVLMMINLFSSFKIMCIIFHQGFFQISNLNFKIYLYEPRIFEMYKCIIEV